MIKVLQFIHGFNMGGAETIVKNYCLNFNKDNIDLYVLCWDRYVMICLFMAKKK